MADLERNKKAVLDAVDELLDTFVDLVFQKCVNKLINDGKLDTGKIVQTANVNREYLSKSLVFPVNYAESIEYGRSPGTMPPVSELETWVRRKLAISDARQAKSIAFAIAMKIKERGIAEFPFLRSSIDESINEMGLNR